MLSWVIDSDGEFFSNLTLLNSSSLPFFIIFIVLALFVFQRFFFCLWATLGTNTSPPSCVSNIHLLLSPRAVPVCTVCMCLLLSLFLRGAHKSGKFLPQLVPAVNIPRVHVCQWIRGGLKLCCNVVASGRATSLSLDVEYQCTSVSGSDHQRAAAVSDMGGIRFAC